MGMCTTAWKSALGTGACLVALVLLIMPGCSGKEQPASARRPNVIIITLDTTRADCLGCYGSDIVKTPHLDAFARDAVLFRDCFSTANSTNPSHTSIFTSLYIRDHGVTDNRHRLPEYTGFMPKLFKSAGYLTAAFTSGGHLNTVTNVNQGFDDFVCPEQYAETGAAATTDKVIGWLDRYQGQSGETGERPFMLWVHYFDPHMKYRPPAPYDTMYEYESADRVDWKRYFDLSEEENRKYLDASADPEYFRNMYRGEVSYMDEHVGRLLDRLKETGLFDKSIIVIVADHGESLGEHEIFWDHEGLYDVSTWVPLIIKPADIFSPGMRDQLVSTLDIYPTVMELAGITARTPVSGISLVGILGNPTYPDPRREVYFESASEEYLGVRTREYTYIERVRQADGVGPVRGKTERQVQPELFDNLNDETQTKNFILVRQEAAAYLERKAAAFITAKNPGIAAEEITDKAHLEKLKSLGYIQ